MNVVIYEDVEDLEADKKEEINRKEVGGYDDQTGKGRGHSSETKQK